MAIEGSAPRRDYEEALRSLGQVFDEQQIQDVMLVDRDSGFLVTALRRVDQELLGEEPTLRYEFVAAVYPDEAIVQASMAEAERRGTRHRADRNELAFRLIGRHINEQGGTRVLIVDQGDGFMLRMHEEALAARGGPSEIR